VEIAGIEGIGAAAGRWNSPSSAAIARSTTRPMAKASCPRRSASAAERRLQAASVGFKRDGDVIILIGETQGHLGQSIYLREIEGKEEAAPHVDLAAEKSMAISCAA